MSNYKTITVFLTEEEIKDILNAYGFRETETGEEEDGNPVVIKLLNAIEARKFQERADAYTGEEDSELRHDVHLLAAKIAEHKAEGLADGGWAGGDSWYPIDDLMMGLMADDTMFLYEHLAVIAGWHDMSVEVDGGGFYIYPKGFTDED